MKLTLVAVQRMEFVIYELNRELNNEKRNVLLANIDKDVLNKKINQSIRQKDNKHDYY